MPKKGYKWTKAQKIRRSQQYSGVLNPFYGKKHSQQTKKNIGQFKKGIWNGHGFEGGHIPWNKNKKGLHLSPQTEFKKGQSLPYESYRRGENHPKWKGGISFKYRESYLENIAGRPRPNKCEVCSNQRRIYYDHDHKTGKFRGWICSHCNFILGHSKDNPELLILLSNYLKDAKSKL